MDKMTIITNHVPRDVVEAYELTPKEREEFDYHDWDKIERGEDSPTFFRYKGEVYDLGEFSSTDNIFYHDPLHPFRKWSGYLSDSYFSGMLVKYVDNFERVIVARYYT
jgi:hypothetical protein